MLVRSMLLALSFFAAAHCSFARSEDRPAQSLPYSFGVLPQRSPTLTAQYWNPILEYVRTTSGVALELAPARSGPEHAQAIGQGRFGFIYSNHNFTRDNAVAGYRVIARPRDAAIRGQIVVLASSGLKSVAELASREIAFPSNVAFVGYQVPMDALERLGIQVIPVFAGNQEGAMGQLKSGRVEAAAVNSQLMRNFAEREAIRYRVLWSSEEFLNLPISAHPSVPAKHVAAVRQALLGMAAHTEGAAVLAKAAALVKQDPPYGFVAASDAEYDNQRRFYRTARVPRAAP